MFALETKQSKGKLLPHSDLWGGVFLGEALCSRQRGMKIGTWKVRSLYRAGSLKAAARELVRYKLDVVGVQGIMIFSTGKEMKITNWERVFLYTVE